MKDTKRLQGFVILIQKNAHSVEYSLDGMAIIVLVVACNYLKNQTPNVIDSKCKIKKESKESKWDHITKPKAGARLVENG